MSEIFVRAITDEDREWIKKVLLENWGSEVMVSRGKRHKVSEGQGFIAVLEQKPVGVLTYEIENGSCEITFLESYAPDKGVGSGLIAAAKELADKQKCKRLWLITTNDNTHALHFYQKRGFHLVALYPKALDISRKIKPEIPEIGDDGIPLRDELELEYGTE